jgi:phage/plasmid-associated DNA primase
MENLQCSFDLQPKHVPNYEYTFQDFNDDSDGMIRRLNLFAFPNHFKGDREDPHLTEKLTRPEELARIFKLLVKLFQAQP